jgi:hypothetical protein
MKDGRAMADVLPDDVRRALSSDAPEVVLDRLNALVLELRRGLRRLPANTAGELLNHLPRIKHPLGKVAAWEALEFSPPIPDLLTAGIDWLKKPRNWARAQALGTLLRVFPDQRDALIALCQGETDPFIRYTVARSLAATQPRQAWERLCQLIESEPDLAAELQELIPVELANVTTRTDLPFLEKKARTSRQPNVWTDTLELLYQRHHPRG